MSRRRRCSKKDQPLFKLDPVEYQAAVAAAQANVNVAQAALETSRLTLSSKQDLYNQNIISDFELQTASNNYDSQQAQVQQAQAQLLSARNNLSYTTITSPVDGVVGTIPFRVGSLVSSSTTEPLTTVSDISSVFVYFSLTEKQLLQLTRQGESQQTLVSHLPPVELQLADGTMYPQKGKIETVSGVINSSTGAVNLRATFRNDTRMLRRGGTGVQLIPHNIQDAIVIPQKAT
ncbi:MAG: efflux RND transporter periplasmic adaptor subunit, partial [Tannerellaceae bacterium]|nr:efflux RND transporter periplasmic adaptor subunit [Tannerellaceae bacterium]